MIEIVPPGVPEICNTNFIFAESTNKKNTTNKFNRIKIENYETISIYNPLILLFKKYGFGYLDFKM